MSQDLNPAELESSLRTLAPRTSRLDRDGLLFLAGQASVAAPSRRSLRSGWRWMAALSMVAGLGIGWSAGRATSPAPRLAEHAPAPPGPAVAPSLRETAPQLDPEGGRIVDSPRADDAVRPPVGSNLLALRNRVIARGFDAWDSPPLQGAANGSAPSLGRLRAEALEL